MWVIAHGAERYLMYKSQGKGPMTFASRKAAEKHLRSGNWHLGGLLVAEFVDGVILVPEGTHTSLDW